LDFLLLPLIVCQPKAAQTAAAICLQKNQNIKFHRRTAPNVSNSIYENNGSSFLSTKV
jgi:hypothetical protein